VTRDEYDFGQYRKGVPHDLALIFPITISLQRDRGFMKNHWITHLVFALSLTACGTNIDSVTNAQDTRTDSQAATKPVVSIPKPQFDPAFGQNGTLQFTGTQRFALIGRQSSGKIIGFARSGDVNHPTITLRRLNVDGSEDLSFGSSGKTIFTGVYPSDERFMKVLPSGKILIIKFPDDQSGTHLHRFSADGQVDINFGTDGEVNIGNFDITVLDVHVFENDQLMIHAPATAPLHFKLLKLQADGNPDKNFHATGMTDYIAPSYVGGRTFISANDGGLQHLQAGGYFVNLSVRPDLASKYPYGLLIRLTEDGAVDTHFAPYLTNPTVAIRSSLETQDGYLITEQNILTSYGRVVHVDTNGLNEKTVIADLGERGYTSIIGEQLNSSGQLTTVSSSEGGVILHRFNPDGSSDTNFGQGGVFVVSNKVVPQASFFDAQSVLVWSVYADSLDMLQRFNF
jgi:uncharacterized delta-60 repeat protein